MPIDDSIYSSTLRHTTEHMTGLRKLPFGELSQGTLGSSIIRSAAFDFFSRILNLSCIVKFPESACIYPLKVGGSARDLVFEKSVLRFRPCPTPVQLPGVVAYDTIASENEIVACMRAYAMSSVPLTFSRLLSRINILAPLKHLALVQQSIRSFSSLLSVFTVQYFFRSFLRKKDGAALGLQKCAQLRLPHSADLTAQWLPGWRPGWPRCAASWLPTVRAVHQRPPRASPRAPELPFH